MQKDRVMKNAKKTCRLGLVLAMWLIGCGTEPSLSGADLAHKYPDKKYVQLDTVALHYEQAGYGRPIVFLHGLLASSYMWRNITHGLTYRNTVYQLDLMGFGFSEKPHNVSYSLATYVAQLGAFLDTLHLDDPILVGHDIGAAIVLLYTLRNPDKVRKLVLMSMPSAMDPPLRLQLLRTRLVGRLLTGDWFLGRFLRGGVENQTLMTKALLEAYLSPYHEDPGARPALIRWAREFNLASFLEQEIQPQLSTLQLPTLVVWGSQDRYVPVAVGQKLNHALPNSEIVVISRTGHYVPEERPEAVRAVLKEFVEK